MKETSMLRSAKAFWTLANGSYYQWFRRDRWGVGFVHDPIDTFLDAGARPRINWLDSPGPAKFLADPFGVVRNHTLYILCEEFDSRVSKGRIVWIEVAEGNRASRPRVAIELAVHMSYPYLLEHRGEIYCVPETCRAREISLYKAQEFPCEWKKVASLVSNFAGVDNTVFQYEDRWWLACVDLQAGEFDKLFLWHALDLPGPWKAHEANPVKTNPCSSRPAGTPFMHDGFLYRPSQDCSQTYGGRIVLNRVRKLTPSEFEEDQVAVVEPDANGPYPDGVHTLSSVGGITLIDGKRLPFFKRMHYRTL
jgi:hypothetical protein